MTDNTCNVIADCLGALSLGIWIYLIVARGGFWKMKVEDIPGSSAALASCRIAVIVPARNEAPVITQTIQSLLRQNHSGALRIYLVDDHSCDGTQEVAQRAAEQAGYPDRLVVTQAGPLPDGWTGKLWALSEGVQAATSFFPDYYWFTDADIAHDPENLASLIIQAEAADLDLISLMVKLRCESLAERILVPAFVFFFFKLYPPAWIASSNKRTAAAAGGCILIRPAVVTRIGGIAAIRDQLIDDCALARAVKRQGGRIWLGITTKAKSVREYGSFRAVGRMISRSAFTQLHHSTALLCVVICAMTITYLVPVLLLESGHRWPIMFGLAAWLLMTIAYWPTLRFYRLSLTWALLLPVTALFYMGATIFSALQHWAGRGGAWKGRVQDLANG
jgi:hopene-associated glycosyltransferase HpnB